MSRRTRRNKYSKNFGGCNLFKCDRFAGDRKWRGKYILVGINKTSKFCGILQLFCVA